MGILHQFLSQSDIANDARQPGHEPGRLDSEDGLDCSMGIGRRHGDRSEHHAGKSSRANVCVPAKVRRFSNPCHLP
jgi:hypothetical protein